MKELNTTRALIQLETAIYDRLRDLPKDVRPQAIPILEKALAAVKDGAGAPGDDPHEAREGLWRGGPEVCFRVVLDAIEHCDSAQGTTDFVRKSRFASLLAGLLTKRGALRSRKSRADSIGIMEHATGGEA
jgi:hypothetical protein